VPVAAGQVGRIVIRSRYLSPGYWQRPDLTAAAFSEDPDDKSKWRFRTGDLGRMGLNGLLEHLGRKDSRVKIRGYSIELFEIERALLDLEIVKDAVVTSSEDHAGNLRLIAYVVPARIPSASTNELRFFLTKTLPEYMVPSAFVVLEAIPRNANGKVDRKALPILDRSRPGLQNQTVAPRSPIEKALSEIWTEILGLDSVGIHDHFFDLGGNSLQATQIISRVNRAYGVTVPFRDFFEKPTIENLSLLVLVCLTANIDANTLSRIFEDRE
jgi:acyl carrier protein